MAYLGLGNVAVADTCEVTFTEESTGRFTVCGRPKHGTIQSVLVNSNASRHHRLSLCRTHMRQWNDGNEFKPVRDYVRKR